jgi:hypothetical protein
LNVTHCTADESASFVLGSLDGPDENLLRTHLRQHCQICAQEMKEALEFWYVFAALTERTQDMAFPEPTPILRDRVIAITRRSRRPVIQNWLRIGAGVLIAAGVGSFSWSLGRYEIKRNMSAVQTRADQQTAAAKRLESENDALRNLLETARNAPAVFPGRQIAAADALREERKKAADLEDRLSQTTALLAAATRDKEETDRQYRKAFDAGITERYSTEIAALHAKVQDLESQIARYRTVLLQTHALSVVQLHGTGTGSGIALIADDSRLTFLPANLPAAPAGRTYQLWLIREKSTVSAGTFNGSEVLSNKLLLSGLKGLTVTEEPAGGSPQLTGPKILTGTPLLH